MDLLLLRGESHNRQCMGEKKRPKQTHKQRKDKGTTAFNNETHCKSTFTVKHSFDKIARASGRTPLSNEELKAQFAAASPSTIAKAEQQSTMFSQQAPFLVGEAQ